ncbi:MAG: FAD-binding protein [Novosphingobium sp.]|nr:FAD-binding protein [Novosphingobium sp.]
MAFDETYDLVIIGSGCASVPAALAAKSLGGSAVIIEKQALFGGSTAYSGGIAWMPNNPLLDDDSEEASRTYLNHIVGEPDKASPIAKREAFLKEGPKAVQFLLDQGVELIRVPWPDYYSSAPGGHEYGRTISGALFDLNELGEWRDRLGYFYGFPQLPVASYEFVDLTLAKRTWKGKKAALRLAWNILKDKLTGARRRGSGNAVQGRMLLAALKAEIPLKMETELTGLIVEDGRVAGVTVHGPDGEKRIGAARGVLLNAGGFSRNLEMREKYQPKPTSTDWTMVNPGDTGDVMQMAMALGADIDCMEEAWWTPGSILPDGKYGGFHVPGESGKPHVIFVGPDGKRIGNEAGSYMEFGQRMYAAGAVPCWAILESRALKHYSWGPVIAGKPVKPWIDNGYLVTADTLEGLAKKCGIDPQGFAAEVAKFNGFAAKGVDEDFNRGASHHNRAMGDPTNRPNPSLGPIEKPPYYAVKIWPLDVGTSGGLVTDEHSRVLREDGSIIPGLYAAGNITAPVVSHTYPGAGASIGGGIAFGYVAARHAMGANEGSESAAA